MSEKQINSAQENKIADLHQELVKIDLAEKEEKKG